MKNWKTTSTRVLEAVLSALTVLSILPTSLGELGTLIPADWKPTLAAVGLISTFVLRVVNGIVTQDATPPATRPITMADIPKIRGQLPLWIAAALFLPACLTSCDTLTGARLTVTSGDAKASLDVREGGQAAVAIRVPDHRSGK